VVVFGGLVECVDVVDRSHVWKFFYSAIGLGLLCLEVRELGECAELELDWCQ